MSNNNDNKRIAKNTLMLYVRMLFTMFVSIYTTRVVLQALGENDYGLYNLVGAVVGMMGILTSLLSQGTSRFITIALGKDNEYELRTTFSASFTIHLLFALFIFLLGEVLGVVMIDRLNIDSSRLDAAHIVFQMSLLSAILGIIQAPFNAAIIAHEKMVIYAYMSIIDIVAKLLIVYLLLVINMDKLILYSSFYFGVSVIIAIAYYAYCRRNFLECCSIHIKTDVKLYKEMFIYTGWNAIGACAFTMNGQGITILLNLFGTAIIAARGIANSVSSVVYSFVANFQTAVRPQIFKLYSVGNLQEMNVLISRTSKFSAYLISLVGIPLFIEMDYVLKLWLKDAPTYACVFARLTLIQGLVQAIDFPIGTGIHAVGKMKLPNLTSAFIYMAILPISYLAIKLGTSPSVSYIVIICAYPLAMFMDLYILNKYTAFPIKKFMLKDVLKIILFILIVFVLTQILISQIPPSFIRLLMTTIITTIILLSTVYFAGLTSGERFFVKNFVLSKLRVYANKQ